MGLPCTMVQRPEQTHTFVSLLYIYSITNLVFTDFQTVRISFFFFFARKFSSSAQSRGWYCQIPFNLFWSACAYRTEHSKHEVTISKRKVSLRSFRIGNESQKCLIISRIVTGWTVRGSSPEESNKFSVLHTHWNSPGVHTASSAMVIVDHPLLSRAEIKN